MSINQTLDHLMARFPGEAFTFDDVSLVTRYADFLPADTTLATRFTRNIGLHIPFVSAAMDTVTESGMAIAMALLGGIGVIHKNLPADRQAALVGRVKHHLNGLIADPITFTDDLTLGDILATKKEKGYGFTGFPILDRDGTLVGILSSKDIKFARDLAAPVTQYMTHDVVTGAPGTTLQQAYDIMQQNKVGKLPLVEGGKLVGLYSYEDVRTLVEDEQPLYNRDSRYRLRVAAAVGPDDHERVEALVQEHVDAVVIDTAHGHTRGVIETTAWVKKHYPDLEVVAGNIATAEAAVALRAAGADAIKVGIGPGSICTTRVVTGVGVPQLTAVYECANAVEEAIPVISDGGIRHSGDVPKAITAGASTVMMGARLAGTDESPGEKIIYQGRQYVSYRGMGSLGAMHEGMGSRERYGQLHADEAELVPQGIEGIVPYSGTVKHVLVQFCGGLQSALGYCGCRELADLRKHGAFVRVSGAGTHEGHAHDVTVTKEAPNYRKP